MKIFFTASYSGKEKYQKYYDTVLTAIQSTGVDIISPELNNYKKILTQVEMNSLKTEKEIHYEAIRKGIIWADVVIIEISNPDFQLGYEANLAIQSKKPVLCLSINEDFSEKIHNRYFYGAKYTKFNAKSIVVDFIVKHRKELLSERFNFFISKSQLQHLGIQSEKNGINMSEYLRKLIEDDMAN